MIDPTLDTISKESQRSIGSHLADYESKLRTAGRTDQYIRETVRYIHQIAEEGEFNDVATINADAVTKFASKLRDEGKSVRTIQAYLAAIKGFTRWLSANQKLPHDPLVSVKKPNPKATRRRERRILLPEEWRLLETSTATGPNGMA